MLNLVCCILFLTAFVTFSKAQCSSGARFACVNCSTVGVCSYGGIQVDSYRCDSVDASRPFCSGNTGICKSTPEGNCIKPSELCPRASDTFPYPANCLQYVQCDALKQAQTVACVPASYVYDHSTGSCKRRQTSNDCFQLNCALAGNQNRWASYRPAPSLAIFCSATVGPMTFECTGENQVFNTASRSCVFGCPREGRFPVPDDAGKYYQCVRGVYNVLVVREVSCEAGLVFDSSLASCTSTTTESSPGTSEESTISSTSTESTTTDSSTATGSTTTTSTTSSTEATSAEN